MMKTIKQAAKNAVEEYNKMFGIKWVRPLTWRNRFAILWLAFNMILMTGADSMTITGLFLFLLSMVANYRELKRLPDFIDEDED